MNYLGKIAIESQEIISCLKAEIKLKEVCQNIIYQKIIIQAAQKKDIIVTTTEIEAEAARQRRENNLEKATDTMSWLVDQMITPDDWERGIYNRLLRRKLAEVMFGQEVERFFLQNRSEFEQVILYQMIINNEKLAQELYYQIEEDEISFYNAVHLYDIDENRRQKCGFEGKVYRWAIHPDIATVVFSTIPKQLIGPLKTDQGYHLLIVEEFISAELTPQRYEDILNNIFQQWLATELDYIIHCS